MRELKFKVWDSKRCVWLTPDEFLIDNQGCVIDCGVVDSYATAREGLILVEYTGLKDKNGVEIYERDVVRFSISDTQHYSGTVCWDEARAQFYLQDRAFHMSIPEPHYQHKMEITGNIYENPELVEVR